MNTALVERLILTASRLGLDFASPELILQQLLAARGCSEMTLFAWLVSDEAAQYLRSTYGYTLPLPTTGDQ